MRLLVLSLDLTPVCHAVHFLALPHPGLRRIRLLHPRLHQSRLYLRLLVDLSRAFLAMSSESPKTQAGEEKKQSYSDTHTNADHPLLRVDGFV